MLVLYVCEKQPKLEILQVFCSLTPLTRIVNDQIVKIEAMNLFACNLANKLDRLEVVEEGKFDMIV